MLQWTLSVLPVPLKFLFQTNKDLKTCSVQFESFVQHGPACLSDLKACADMLNWRACRPPGHECSQVLPAAQLQPSLHKSNGSLRYCTESASTQV